MNQFKKYHDRKSLSKIAWEQVAQGMGLALSGNARALKNAKTSKVLVPFDDFNKYC